MLLYTDNSNCNSDTLLCSHVESLLVIFFTERKNIRQSLKYKSLQIIKIYNTSYSGQSFSRDFLKLII